MALCSQNYGFGNRDHGFEIRDPEKPIPDPGVKKAPDPGSATLVSVNLKRSRPKIIKEQDQYRVH
jgi:hypothetical protein